MPTPRLYTPAARRDDEVTAYQPIFLQGGGSAGPAFPEHQPSSAPIANPLESRFPPRVNPPDDKHTAPSVLYREPSGQQWSSCMGRPPRDCMGRPSPQRRPLTHEDPSLRRPLPAVDDHSSDSLTYLKEVLWVSEKSLSILSDMYQDHLTAKHTSPGASAVSLRPTEVPAGLEPLIRECITQGLDRFTLTWRQEITAKLAGLEDQMRKELTYCTETQKHHLEDQLKAQSEGSNQRRPQTPKIEEMPVPRELSEALASMSKKIDVLGAMPPASTATPPAQQGATFDKDAFDLAVLEHMGNKGVPMTQESRAPEMKEPEAKKMNPVTAQEDEDEALFHCHKLASAEEQDNQEDYIRDQEIRGRGAIDKPPKVKDDTSFSSVFANDTDLGKPVYDAEALYHTDGCAQAVARDHHFQHLGSFMIVVNAIYLGIDAESNDATNLYDADWGFIVFENIFCVFFSFEFIVRFMAFRVKADVLHDGWMRFDGFLVGSMLLESWVLMPALKSSSSSVAIPVAPLRLLRLLKLTRMARMMHAFPELITMVKGLVRSMRAISSSMLLVSILLYSFAILIHMLMKDDDDMNRMLQDEVQFEFSTIPHCMWTLSMAGVFMLDGAANIATYLVFSRDSSHVVVGWLFLIFTILSAMTVLQMLIGVLCEVVSDTNREHEASKVVSIMKQQLMAKLRHFDDGDGRITQGELNQILRDEESQALLRSLNVNRLFLLEMQRLMFPREDSTVAFQPLTEMLLMCRGNNAATVETLASGFSYLVSEIRESERRMLGRWKKFTSAAGLAQK